MKKLFTICLAVCMALCASASAFAMEVPVQTVVQNLNGTQQYIKTYTVSTETDPASLIEDDFTYEGFDYTYSGMTKSEHWLEDELQHSEVITAETAKKDLSSVLEVLPVSVEYDDGKYFGTLRLDHTSISTEAAGYASKTSTVYETREITDLDDCDMSFVPVTVQKDGNTLNLSACQWEVMGTTLVDDMLVPSCYKAVASYTGQKKTTYATGYITTANYTGTVSCNEVDSITYTVTYTGKESVPEEPEALEAVAPVEAETEAPVREATGEKVFAGRNEMILALSVLAAMLVLIVLTIVRSARKDAEEEEVVCECECEKKDRS